MSLPEDPLILKGKSKGNFLIGHRLSTLWINEKKKGGITMYHQNFMQQPSVPQYPAQQPPAPQCPAPEYPGQYPYPQQTSISASVWSQQYVQYVPDWSCTNALLQYQAEIDRLHRQLEQKTLKEEELKNLFTMHGNGYFSTMGSGRVVQLTCFLFERVEELIYDPLYGRKSQVRIKLTTQVESDLLDMDDFLNDKKFLLFLERLSRSKIKCYSSAKQVSMLLRSIAAERMIGVYYPYFGGWIIRKEGPRYYTFSGFRTIARPERPEQYEKVHAKLPANARAAAEDFAYRLSPIQHQPLRAFCTIWLHLGFLQSILVEHGVRLSKIPTISAENPVVQAYLRTVFSLRPDDVLSMGTEPTSFSRALASCKDQPYVLLPAAYGRNSMTNEKTLREALVTGEINVPSGKQTRSSYRLGALPVLLSDGTSCPLGSDCGIPIDVAEGDFDLAVCARIIADRSCQETYWSAFVAFVAKHWDAFAEGIHQDHMRLALEESAAHAYTSEHVAVLGAMSWAAELIRCFYHELSVEEDVLCDAVWKEFVIDALEEGAAQYAAPDGLTDIFFCVARDLIRLKRIPCYRTAQCFDTVPHGVAYLDDEHICFDKPAFERVCQEAKCKPSDVKDKLFGKRYLLGKPATTSGRSYETRISLRVNGKGRYTARVYKFERARFEVFGEPALFEGGNG